ncbi:MAG: MarR family transcriptional regulator [Clostridiales bacterium]|jgi:DNA-binding MarR family transcriptional regulator|nr:MarR family transcriptional regulator [Clostridiales bacterium]MCI2161409.1 MarR family transcriptional regulator [Oscillospiraceae bacterium]CAB1247768.1 DNA-binding MarR family transcriptional regulator [Ruminococcaceae bacterium BL-4]MCI1962017.1 MarR family transcriptional regulator [Clostridiales bacterium]MCI2022250.1 MarR family transcriptional regulator [Clostridiales bacterium]
MLDQEFERLYLRLRATYYRRMVSRIGTREGSLSATESFCVEIIYLLGTPTVSKFAQFLNISLPNATYKINRLINKGYVEKEISSEDHREIYLTVTPKFSNYYGLKNIDIAKMMKNIHEKFSKQEIEQLESMVKKICKECFPDFELSSSRN